MKKVLFSAIAIAAMVGCSKTEEIEIDNWNGELRITSGIESRASGTLWESGDAIGVFMSETTTTTAVGLHNTQYTTDTDTGSAEFKTPDTVTPLYYPQSGTVDIVAHYPYNTSASVDSYPIDVTSQSVITDAQGATTDNSDLTAIDFMSTKKMVGESKSSSAISLTFYHLLTQVKVVLTPGDGLTADDLKTATVKISGTKATATAGLTYDATTYKPSATFDTNGATTATDLSVKAVDGTATLIVVPQSDNVTFTITVANIGDLTTAATDLTFTSGYEQTYSIEVNRTAASITSSTIFGWVSTGNTTDGTLSAK